MAFRIHYRRLLTSLLAHPLLAHLPAKLPLGSTPSDALVSFRAFVTAVLAKLKLDLSVSQLDELLDEADRLEVRFGGWRWEGRGMILQALAISLGSVTES